MYGPGRAGPGRTGPDEDPTPSLTKKLININVNDVVDKFFKPFAFCIIK
jgi:hypothetical protein